MADEPISVQIRRAEPRLAGLPYRVLLDFEKAVDLAFLEDLVIGGEDREVAAAGAPGGVIGGDGFLG